MAGFGMLTKRALLGGSAAAALSSSRVAFGKSDDQVLLSLEFRTYGANAPSYFGIDNGIYSKLGLNVVPEGSSGSGESVRRVAAGTHFFGFADASTLIAFAADNPAVTPKIVLPIFDRFPAVILSLKRKPVKALKELVGLKLGIGSADAGGKIFPALLEINKIDPASISLVNVDVKLRDAMLLTGAVDAVIAFDYTSIFNLVDNGVKIEDINLLYYSESGFDFIGNSLIVNRDMLATNPDLVRRVTTAVAQTWIVASQRRAEAIASVVKREGLLNPTVERMRLDWVIDKHVRTDNVRANGLGTVDIGRLQRAIAFLKQGFQLPVAPAVADIFDDRFMPAAEDRKIG
jgi:NitT/TauT family transport system substrate-binding protein